MDALGEQLAELLDRPEALAFVLLMARLGPLVLFSPLFGGASTPLRLRLGISTVFAAALTPLVGPVAPADPLTASAVPMLAATELLVGTTLAVLVSAIFGLFAAGGALIDRTRGFSPGEEQEEASRLNVFFILFFVTVFVVSGGLRLVLAAFGNALVRLPLGGPLLPATGPGTGPGTGLDVGSDPGINTGVTLQIAALTGELFAAALQLALPVIAIALVVDVALGILNRAAGPISAFFMGLTIKGILGVAVLLFVIRIGAEEFLEAVPPLVRRLAEGR